MNNAEEWEVNNYFSSPNNIWIFLIKQDDMGLETLNVKDRLRNRGLDGRHIL
jgi:hypothetical protein